MALPPGGLTMKIFSFRALLIVFLLFFALSSSAVLFSQQRADQSPEYKEFLSALRIEDLNARVKELERIKAAYPNSTYLPAIENAIIRAKIGLATDVESILQLQKTALQSAQGARRIFSYYIFCLDILEHKNLAQFDKKKVTQAVEQYAAEGLKLASDPEFLKAIAPDQQEYLKSNTPTFYLASAMAYLNEDILEKSMKALEDFKKNGGMPGGLYFYTLASAYAKSSRNKEALDAYFEAAVENYRDSVSKARELWEKVYGSSQGFESKLEARRQEVPFHAEPFKPSAEWKGKTVLAELFTGSGCSPCVGTDLGLDGLIKAYGSMYVAVLEYHLSVPRPDPMMNMVTRKRAQFYGVNSAPTIFFDGENRGSGGGSRQMAEGKFKEYSAEVNARVYALPEAKLKVSAKLKGDSVEVKFSADKEIPAADYNLALVQKEEKYQGGNGIVFHKMVVRDFLTLDAAALKSESAQFSIPKAEQDAEARLSQHEKERGFTFKERHSKIDRQNLMVVFFLQDRDVKKVYNAAVAEVKK